MLFKAQSLYSRGCKTYREVYILRCEQLIYYIIYISSQLEIETFRLLIANLLSQMGRKNWFESIENKFQ